MIKSINVGDLIFCHAVGGKYGWYLNQVAVVLAANPTKDVYTLYLTQHKKRFIVKGEEFHNGSVELISSVTGYSKKIRAVDETVSNVTRIYWENNDTDAETS